METKIYNFSTIHFSDLEKIVDIRPKLNMSKFEQWFSFNYLFSDEETTFLKNLITRHFLLLVSYME